MKKTLLTTTALALLSAGVMAQGTNKKGGVSKKSTFSATTLTPTSTNSSSGTKYNRCGTVAPSAEWDAAFNKQVEAYKAQLEIDMLNGRTTATTFTIPIIFHIVYGSEAEGTFPNINKLQVASQITVLNQDYAGTGYQTSTYPATAFQAYAAAATNSVSAASKDGSGRVAIANTGITFCAATKDPTGATLAEPGIDRVSYVTKGWTNPATLTSANFQTYIDGTIKPGSIWDPTKYFNVWLTDELQGSSGAGLLGYSTFPASSTLTGLSAPYGTATTDGCWFWTKVCGSINIYAAGSYDPTYKYGRTICHECGHYLGLRHPWGDNGQCGGTDYCNDTPPEQGQTNSPPGCYYGTPTYPSQPNTCTENGQTNTNGDMFMNIMDYTDDVAMYMFTNDQAIRMQTALSNSPNRKNLTASAANLCAGVTVVAPVAGFTYPSTICPNAAAAFSDASTGPAATYTWSSNPSTGVTISTVNSSNPSITFPAAGSYTVTQAVTNTVGTNSTSHVVTVGSCVLTACDTLSNFLTSDTLTVFHLPSTAGHDSGYVSGTNAYGDLAKATYYDATTLANTQIKSVICLFYKNGTAGTHGTGTVTVNILGGTNTAGPTGAALGTATASLAAIVASTATTSVKYCGNPALGFSTAIMVPYTFTFATPVTTPTGGFFASLNIPTVAGDTLVVFENTDGTHQTTNTAWELNTPSPGTWASVQADWQFTNPVSFAILPIVCPTGTTDIQHNELGSAINLFPNPNNGQFNFAVNLTEAANLNFTVINMLGQVVYTKSENNITNAVLSCDLSHLSKGVYYANITDGKNNKTVKKIIIE
ncbi:MAG TPA: T9SS type A sorting domain-containing protein [Bacteroidia bacterium]|nr:T9SS type A sorting domain-containing protein [Bacteroidia bacterium]